MVLDYVKIILNWSLFDTFCHFQPEREAFARAGRALQVLADHGMPAPAVGDATRSATPPRPFYYARIREIPAGTPPREASRIP